LNSLSGGGEDKREKGEKERMVEARSCWAQCLRDLLAERIVRTNWFVVRRKVKQEGKRSNREEK